MFHRIAIMGVGALGTVLGAYISMHRQIDLIDVNKQHVEALNRTGANISGAVTLRNIPVHAITPDEMQGEYDLYIYMAKQTCNEACLPQMKKYSHANTYVCCCQNGLPEYAVCKYFEKNHVFGASVGWGATWLKPGCSEITTVCERQNFSLGSISGTVTPELLETKSILEYMCRVVLSENLVEQRWTKLHINAAYSGLSAVLGGTFGEVSEHELAIKWAVHVAQECMNICKAKGIQMVPAYSKKYGIIDFMEIYGFTSSEEEKVCIDIVKDMNAGSGKLVASILQDLRKGKPCEVDAIVGVVVEAGKEVCVPTPYTEAVLQVIKKKEAGEISVDTFPVEYYPGNQANDKK